MRAVLTRVKSASVTIDGAVKGQIGKGFLVLLGVHTDDTEAEAERIADRICGLRVFEDDAGKMNVGPAGAGAEILITEKLLTHGEQHAVSEMDVILNGENSKTRVVSRSVAKDDSTQIFYPRVQGNCACFGHVSCDAIIMGGAKVRSIPEISCNHVDAALIHEAAIGKIAGEQLLKLQTLGMTSEQAEEKILEGFLR